MKTVIALNALFLALTLALPGPQNAAAASLSTGQAEVLREGLIVHAEMATTSQALNRLNRGQQVTVRLKMLGPGTDGPWCAVSLEEDAKIAGYVQCEFLQQSEAGNDQWLQIGGGTGPRKPNLTTKVRIFGNQVLVPVTLTSGWKSEEVLLILDTGATQSVIDSEVAASLNINISRLEKSFAQVVGGALIATRSVQLDSVRVGPHTRRSMEITVIEHRGPAVHYKGLLGMDFLRGVRYDIDFEKQTIQWEPP